RRQPASRTPSRTPPTSGSGTAPSSPLDDSLASTIPNIAEKSEPSGAWRAVPRAMDTGVAIGEKLTSVHRLSYGGSNERLDSDHPRDCRHGFDRGDGRQCRTLRPEKVKQLRRDRLRRRSELDS